MRSRPGPAFILLVVLSISASMVMSQEPSQDSRKLKTEAFLKSRGVPINEWLPRVESEDEVQLRDARDVAIRAIILYGLAAAGHGEDRSEIRASFEKSGIWEQVSPNERDVFLAKELTDRQRIDSTWRVEALWALLWGLGLVEDMPYPTELCDMQILHAVMAKSKDIESFLNDLRPRSKTEVLDEVDKIYRIHWAVVDARLNGRNPPDDLHPSVVYERHYALNWLVWYADEWDDITTDT